MTLTEYKGHWLSASQPGRDSFIRLAGAILLQAVRDAAGFDPVLAEKARWWLVGDGLVFCQLLGLEPRSLLLWLRSGCPRGEWMGE